MSNSKQTRRSFLQTAAALAAAGPAASRLGLPLAGLAALSAQGSRAADVSGGYKAVVCLYMSGGNDSHNWVVPIDGTGYAEYAVARRELAWPLAKLLPIGGGGQASGRQFGMPEELEPLRKWYQSGHAAVVANVGPLARPTTVADFRAGKGLPSKLFSHNDQASNWQSMAAEGARSGWGGRMADLLMSANAYPAFTAMSANGNAVFLAGNQTTQYQVGLEGPVAVPGLTAGSIFGSTQAPDLLRRVSAAAGNNPLQAEYAKVMQRSTETGNLLSTALSRVGTPAVPATAVLQPGGGPTTLDKTSLARQLSIVARLIGAGQTLGMRRQVFLVNIGGFDSHNRQMRDQPALMAQVSQGIDYFLSALGAMGLLGNVTLFTASDFGRTLLSNGDGSDHGWGGHQFVAGGAVAGGRIHGRFPITAIGAPDDIGSGRLLPAYSVSQLAAPIGRWLGLTEAELQMTLPGLNNFDSRALAFL